MCLDMSLLHSLQKHSKCPFDLETCYTSAFILHICYISSFCLLCYFFLECQLVDSSFKSLLPHFHIFYFLLYYLRDFLPLIFFSHYILLLRRSFLFSFIFSFYPALVLWTQYLSYHYKNISFGLSFEVLCGITVSLYLRCLFVYFCLFFHKANFLQFFAVP